MTLLAVAPTKFSAGVEPPGTHDRRGVARTYDWRAPAGDPDNTAGVEAAYTNTSIEDALTATYGTDAHFVAYVVRREGAPLLRQPRVNKPALPWLLDLVERDESKEKRYLVTLDTLVADVDRPGHADWPSRDAAAAEVRRVVLLLGTAGVYATRGGLRIVQPLARGLDVSAAEGSIRAWLAGLEAVGLAPDWNCTDWTRHYRAPNVRRDRQPYRSPLIDLVRMRPVDAPAPAGVVRARGPRAARTAASVQVARELSAAWAPLAGQLGKALAPFAASAGERHAISLALAGALLARRVPAEQVPALVAASTMAAGWPRDRAEEFRSSGVDTVRRWADGLPVAGLSALPTVIAEALVAATDTRRAQVQAEAPPTPDASLAEVTRKLGDVLASAPIGLTVIKAQCGLGKTHAARAEAVVRAGRSGNKRNTKTSIAVPTTELAKQVTADLRAKGLPVLRIFGPLSVEGGHEGYECRFRAAAAALAEGGQSVQRLYCHDCEHQPDCTATEGQDGSTDARIVVGPHALLADLDKKAGDEGLLFIDEPPPLHRDELFTVDDLAHAGAMLPEHFEPRYRDSMAVVLDAVRKWVVATRDIGVPGPLTRAFDGGVDARLLDRAFDATGAESAEEAARRALGERQTAPPIERYYVRAARRAVGLAMRLGRASRVLGEVHRAIVREGITATVYDRGGRTLALTGIDPDVENALIGAKRDGMSKDRRVVVAGADAHLHRDQYRKLLGDGAKFEFHDFAAPDGARIERVMLVINGSRARLATDDSGPIEVAARLVAEWAVESRDVQTCGVVTFKRHEGAVRRALKAAAPGVHWEVAHYGAVRGLDRWKDFDAVATIGDPRPNLDAVSRELGGGGDEVEERFDRANDRARAELEQAHGRLRTVHRTRPGRALHVGALLPGGWYDLPDNPIVFRRPPPGRIRRPAVDDIALLVAEAGGQRAAARAVGRSLSTVQRWLSGEGRPHAADRAALSLAGTSRRRSVPDVSTDPVSPLERIKGDTGSPLPLDQEDTSGAAGTDGAERLRFQFTRYRFGDTSVQCPAGSLRTHPLGP